METGIVHSSASSHKAQSRSPLQEQFLQRRSYRENLDRFIPNRSAMDFSSNVLSIALGSTVYLWDAADGSTSELVTFDEESGPVTSVKWPPDGRHIAIGLNNSEVQLWDSTANRLLRTLRGGNSSRVGALAWKNHILATGGMDGQITSTMMQE